MNKLNYETKLLYQKKLDVLIGKMRDNGLDLRLEWQDDEGRKYMYLQEDEKLIVVDKE